MLIGIATSVSALAGVSTIVTPYNRNSPIIGQEFGSTALYGVGGLSVGQYDCTLAQPRSTYDNARLMARLDAGSAGTIMGFPGFVFGNPFVWGGVALTPKRVSELSTFWNRMKWSYSGGGDFNLLVETMLTDVPMAFGVTPEWVLEVGILLRMPEKTKQFVFFAPYTNLGGFVDAYGRAWGCAFKSGEGTSTIGYCIFYPADMDARLDTEHDYVAMLNYAIPKIAGATTSLYVNGLAFGMEPFGSSGTNTITRETWIRAFDNAPALNPAAVKENIFPNSRFLSDYGRLNSTSGFTISGNGKLAVNTPSQFNNQAFFAPLQNGVTYSITWDQTVTSGGVRIDLVNASNSAVVTGSSKTGSGSQSQSLTATATTVGVRVTTTLANTVIDITNLRCTPV